MFEPIKPAHRHVDDYIAHTKKWVDNIENGSTDLQGRTFKARVVEQFLVNATYSNETQESEIAEEALLQFRAQMKEWNEALDELTKVIHDACNLG